MHLEALPPLGLSVRTLVGQVEPLPDLTCVNPFPSRSFTFVPRLTNRCQGNSVCETSLSVRKPFKKHLPGMSAGQSGWNAACRRVNRISHVRRTLAGSAHKSAKALPIPTGERSAAREHCHEPIAVLDFERQARTTYFPARTRHQSTPARFCLVQSITTSF